MFKGFYNLTSGMLSQSKRLDVVANNMSNVSTTGFKKDTYTDSTFKDAIISRIGNKDKKVVEELGNCTYILAPSHQYIDYTEGGLDETELSLDFAIRGDGFFAIQQNGQTCYTRAGSFIIDDDGYLALSGQGRVLDNQGRPIHLTTDKIQVDNTGAIRTDDGKYVATLGVYAFADNESLTRNEQGLFVGEGATISNDYAIYQGMVERSNVEMVNEMVAMMSAQRALQSAAQMSKIYDEVMSKATGEIGRL
ncbi:MAG: flagellar hook-basal body protein [Firmicutes bacterium]|nr:flagellar hook-basal body protein [Bacillota bacterium]